MKAIRILTPIISLFSGVFALAADSTQVAPAVSLTGEKAVAQLKESGQYDSLAAAYEAARHAVRPDEAQPDAVLHAQTPGHGLSASFDRHGLHLSVQRLGSDGERLTTRWRLDSVGREGAVEKVPAGDTLRRDGQRAEIVRAGLGLTEWFINRPSGLEHGFTLDRRPAGEGDLRLDIAIEGDLSPVVADDGQRIELHDAAGAKVLDYDKLRVWDAAGRELPARMEQGETDGLRFRVEDAGARYPLTVDPTFTQRAYLKASNTGAGDNFGQAVAVSGDTVVVGANGEDSSTAGINSTPNESAASAGAVYVFVRSGSTWTQQAYLKATQVTANDNFGFSVAVNGNTVVVGANLEDSSTTGINSTPDESATNAGAAYVFVRSGSTWTQQAYLKAAQVTANDNFGFSVAVSGDTVVVGARDEDSGTTGINTTPNESALNAGAVYVFVRSGSTWTQQAYLKAANAGAGDQFGYSVGVSVDTVVVGANLEDSSTTGVDSTPDESSLNAGAAYVFVRSSGAWTQQAYLKPAAVGTTQADDNFGVSVAVSGNTVAVGAYLEDSGTAGTPDESLRNSGAAYVFERSGSTWTQQAYLKELANRFRDDHFGYSVAVDGNTVVVGIPRIDLGLTEVGMAYVFVRSVSTWTRQASLAASNFGADDQFGWSVAASGDTVVFGAYFEDSSTTGINSTPNESALNAGAAYVFTLIPDPTLTSVAPNTGSTAGGTAVTLTGTNFTGATGVTFGGTNATAVNVVNATTITCTTPARAAGAVSVVVTTPGGTNAANTLFTYVPPPPTLTSVNPAAGSTAGGTAVTLTGTNFTGATNVTFGGTAVTNRVVVNSTTITCTTPAGTAGAKSVLVTTPGGTNAANTLFTYVDPSVNMAPTAITPSRTLFPENRGPGEVAATLTATDGNLAQSHTYTLVSGTGSADNSAFTIRGAELVAVDNADFETKNSYSVRVRATDSGSPALTFEQALVLQVRNGNDPPSNIVLSATSFPEDHRVIAANGLNTLGLLSATDQDPGSTFTYSIAAFAGTDDNSLISIVGNTLFMQPVFNFEKRSLYKFRIKVTDNGLPGFAPLSLIKEISVNVTDVNEPSSVTNVTASRRPGSKLVDVSYNLSDPDANTTVSVSMVASADNGVTWDIPVSSATGDIGPSVKAFQDNGELSTGESLAKSYRTITWDAGSNWNDQKSESMRVRLTVGTTTSGVPAAIRGVNSTTNTITSNVFTLNTIGNGTFNFQGFISEQATLTGLSGVTISMGGSTATSDASGWFSLDNVTAGPITYSKANYHTISQPSPVVGNTNLSKVFLGVVPLRAIQPNFTGPFIEWYTADITGTMPSGFKVQVSFAVHVAWGNNTPSRFEVVAQKTPGNQEIITTLTGPGPYNFTVSVDDHFPGSFDLLNNRIIFRAVPVAPALPAEFNGRIYTIPLPERLANLKPSEANKMQFPPVQIPGQPPRSLNHLGFDYTIVDTGIKVAVPALGDFGFAFKAESNFDYTIGDGNWQNAVVVGDMGLFGGQFRGSKRFTRPGSPFEVNGDRPKLELYLGPRVYSGAIVGLESGNASPGGINPSGYEVALALKQEDGLPISIGTIFPQLEPVDWLLGEITLFSSVSLNGSAKVTVDPFKIEEGTIGGSIGRRAEYEIGGWVARASAGIGGVANATFRLPPPILKDAGIRFFATWEYGLTFWSYDGEFTIGEFRYTGPSQFQPSGATGWKLTERKWREGGVEAFLQTPRSGGMAIMSAGNTTSRISPELALFNQLGAAASVNVIPSDPSLPAQAVLPLLANVMPLATPSLAQRDGKLMLVYVRDTGAANPVQFSEVAFTYYDGTSWTTPGPIAADARGQIDAQVAFAGNGDAIAVWNRIKDAAFADTTGPEQMAPQLEIVAARWSSATRAWGPVVALTNNSILDSRPILSGPLTDGDLMLSWVSNPSSEWKGSGAPGAATNDQHLVARWDTATSTWSAPTVVNPSVTNNHSVAFAARGNKAAFVWIQDLDGDSDTSNDTELYSQVWNGTSWGSATRITNDLLGDRPPQVAISPSGDIYTLWVSGTDLVMQTNFTGPRSLVRPDSGDAGFSDCTLTVADNGRVLALWQAMSATGSDAFYRIFDPASNTWGLDDQLSRDSSMEKSFSAVWDSDSNLVIAYNNVEMVPTTRTVTNGDGTTNVFEGVNTPGTNDLLLARRRIVTDLALVADSFVAKADTFLPGSVMALKATLKNTGNLAVQNATVTFYLGDPAAGGTVIGSTTVNGWLRASEERVISQNWTIPSGLTQLVQIYAVADPASAVTEFDETNNRLVYETSGKDLELSYLGGTVLRDGSFNVSARVLNTGVTDSAVTDLRLWTGLTQTAAPISNEPVGRLAPGRSADVTFRMPAGSFAGGDQRYNMVLNSSARDAEINQSDNQSSFTLSLFIDDDGDGIPLEWETANGQSDSNPTDGNVDSDGDGFTNRQEYLAGTNPRNRTSVLKVGEFNVQAVPGSLDRVFTISWASVAEKLYVVERSTDFVTWTPVASGVTATAPLNTWRDEPNAATRVFYRVSVQ